EAEKEREAQEAREGPLTSEQVAANRERYIKNTIAELRMLGVDSSYNRSWDYDEAEKYALSLGLMDALVFREHDRYFGHICGMDGTYLVDYEPLKKSETPS